MDADHLEVGQIEEFLEFMQAFGRLLLPQSARMPRRWAVCGVTWTWRVVWDVAELPQLTGCLRRVRDREERGVRPLPVVGREVERPAVATVAIRWAGNSFYRDHADIRGVAAGEQLLRLGRVHWSGYHPALGHTVRRAGLEEVVRRPRRSGRPVSLLSAAQVNATFDDRARGDPRGRSLAGLGCRQEGDKGAAGADERLGRVPGSAEDAKGGGGNHRVDAGGVKRKRSQQPGSRGHCRRSYDHLPREERVHEPDSGLLACRRCGAGHVAFGEERSEDIDVEVVVKIIVHLRPPYSE